MWRLFTFTFLRSLTTFHDSENEFRSLKLFYGVKVLNLQNVFVQDPELSFQDILGISADLLSLNNQIKNSKFGIIAERALRIKFFFKVVSIICFSLQKLNIEERLWTKKSRYLPTVFHNVENFTPSYILLSSFGSGKVDVTFLISNNKISKIWPTLSFFKYPKFTQTLVTCSNLLSRISRNVSTFILQLSAFIFNLSTVTP